MSTRDGPNVIVFPPIIIVATVSLAAGCNDVPLGLLARVDPTCRWAAGILILSSVCFPQLPARSRSGASGTNVLPSRPATALITGGIYRWTRNPMYTGGAPVMVGIAIIFALDWFPS